MENAVQSVLQVSSVPPADVARALLLRAKTLQQLGTELLHNKIKFIHVLMSRVVCWHHYPSDLLSVLSSDPANQDVKAIIQSQHLRQEMVSWTTFYDIGPLANTVKLIREPDGPPRFSAQVWREIALYLPKRDLKSLLSVPHALSRIASQLIFREIDLHFTASPEPLRADDRYKGVVTNRSSTPGTTSEVRIFLPAFS
jgi:hypothetical protein